MVADMTRASWLGPTGAVLLALAGPARAAGPDTLAPPTGDAILVVSGAIERTTDGIAALFDAAALEALAGHDEHGTGPCVVPLDVLLAHLGAHGDHAEFRTLDDRRARVSVVAGAGDLALVLDRGDGGDDRSTVALASAVPDGDLLPRTSLERVVRIRIE